MGCEKEKRLKALEELSRLDQELGLDAIEWCKNFEIDGLKLVCTCGACPEQYDVFDGERQVGYLRLRHGHFRADCPDAGGETVYEAETEGDGVFSEEERRPQMEAAIKKIREWASRAGS